MKIFGMLVLFFAVQAHAQPKDTPSLAELKQLKAKIQENSKKKLPNVFTESEIKALNISSSKCDQSSVNKSLLACEYHNCIQPFMLPGVYLELIVHGLNPSGQCVVSLLGNRYFVPKKDLPTFQKLVFQSSARSEGGSDRSTATQTLNIDGKTCRIKAEYRNEFDSSNAEIVKFSPPKKDGMEIIDQAGRSETLYTEKGTTYRVKSGEVNFISKLIGVTLEPDSSPGCKEAGATLIYDLEKRGLVQALPIGR
jgi:hypothetical protein